MPDDITQLVPHRAPMCWIDALTDCTATTARATATFGPGHFAVANGVVMETALIECVAQTIAAAMTRRALDKALESAPDKSAAAAPANGMLVAVSNFKIQARPPLNEPLQIEILERTRLGRMLMISGSVTCAGQAIAAGDLTLYV